MRQPASLPDRTGHGLQIIPRLGRIPLKRDRRLYFPHFPEGNAVDSQPNPAIITLVYSVVAIVFAWWLTERPGAPLKALFERRSATSRPFAVITIFAVVVAGLIVWFSTPHLGAFLQNLLELRVVRPWPPVVGPKRLQIVDPQNFAFFHPITGKPLVWYYKWPDGKYDFFDGPGKDPGTGMDLTPIDRPTIEELIRRYKSYLSSDGILACGLGIRWFEQESSFSSVWVRRGHSDVFDAQQNPGGPLTVNTVTYSRGKVYVERTESSDGNLCSYEGSVGPDGKSISGTYHSSNGRVPGLWTWKATIVCE